MEASIQRFVATSPLPEDATIACGRPAARQLRPRAPITRLSRALGGVGLVDIATHCVALQTKVVADALGPGRHPWLLTMRGLLAAACPYQSGTVPWLLMGAAPAADAPAIVHTYTRAFVSSRPE